MRNFGRGGGGGGGHHSGGGGRGGGFRKGFRSRGIGPGYAYPIYVNDCDLVYDANTGQMVCVEPSVLPVAQMSGGMGVSLNPLDWFTSQGTLDIENGDKVLNAYYTAAIVYPDNFQYSSYDDFRSAIGGDNFVGALGANVRTNAHPGLLDVIYFPYDDAAKRVQALAASSMGQATPAQINGAAIDTSPDALASISQAATDTATNLASGISSTSNLLKYLPWILGLGAAIYLLPEMLAAKKLMTKSNPRLRYLKTGRTRGGQFQRKVIGRARYRSGRAAPKKHSTVNKRISEELRVIKEGVQDLKKLRKILAGQVRSGEYRPEDAKRVLSKARKELYRAAKIAGLKKFPR